MLVVLSRIQRKDVLGFPGEGGRTCTASGCGGYSFVIIGSVFHAAR